MSTRLSAFICTLASLGATLSCLCPSAWGQTQRYEAEAGRLTGVEVVEHSAASGTGRVRHIDQAGDRVSITVTTEGDWLRIWYALAGREEKVGTLQVDDHDPQRLVFRPTGGWHFYSSAIVRSPVSERVTVTLTEDDMQTNNGTTSAALDCIDVLTDSPPAVRDMDEIRRRIMTEVTHTPSNTAAQWMESLQPDGTWPDLNYKGFPGTRHLDRIACIAAAWAQPGHPLAQQTAARDAALLALDWWLDNDPTHSNWWINDVPVPPRMGNIVLLLQDQMSPEQKAKADVCLYRGWPPPPGGTGLGANLFYRLDGAVRQALIKSDPGMMQSVFARAAGEIRITRSNGIQADYSFLQHGPQFYAGSYGMEFTRYGAYIAKLGHGTAFAMPPEKVELLTHFILDCQQWIACGTMLDPAAMGRAITRSGFSNAARGLIPHCRTFASLGWPRADEFLALADRLEKGAEAEPTLSGNRLFWRADFMVHRRPSYYLSVNVVSNRTVGTEGGNGEGLKNFHLPDGAMIAMTRGDEYHDIQPVWNWRKIPGITCEQDDDPLPVATWGRYTRGKTAYAGGAGDGRHGVMGYHFLKDGVEARKAWFCFDRETVCLGADIQCDGDAPVLTTLNQCLQKGQPMIGQPGRNGAPHESGKLELATPTWVWHDRIGYVLQQGGRAQLATVTQEGSWREITRGGSTAPVRKDVFTLAFDHGIEPREATYVAAVIPDIDAAAMQNYTAKLPYGVLRNDASVQAVHHRQDGIIGAAFYNADSLDLTDLGTLTVDNPCAMLIDCSRPGQLALTVANPAYEIGKTTSLAIRIPGKWTLENESSDSAALSPEADTSLLSLVLDQGASRTVALRTTAN